MRYGVPTFRFIIMLCVLLVSLGLAGCTTLMETGNNRRAKDNVLASSSYAAADMLIQQSRSFITPHTPLEIGVLNDLDNPNEKTNFGRMVAEQIASRFVQLGYNVADSDNPVSVMSAAPESEQTSGQGPLARSSITGRYAVAREGVIVNLRVVENASGKVLAAYDYTVPKTPDVRELTKTRADKDSFFSF